MLSPMAMGFSPYMLYSKPQSLGVQRVLDQSVEGYYNWGNLKKRISLDLAKSALTSPSGDDNKVGSAVGTALISYFTLTVGEKLGKWYQHRLQNFTAKHPGFEEFRNGHPILGSILAWTPGIGVMALGAGGAGLLGLKLWKTSAARQLAKNPAFLVVGGAALLVATIMTSFWGILAKNGLQSVTQSGTQYRAMRKENPALSPAQLKQLIKAQRNQRYLAQYRQHQENARQADLDPFYGVQPYALEGRMPGERMAFGPDFAPASTIHFKNALAG